MNNEEFVAMERKQQARSEIATVWALTMRKIEDGRPVEIIPMLEAAVTAADAFGEEFTTTDYPVCAACQGTGEIRSPAVADRKVRCQDMPYRTGGAGECQGNRYGRMHPTQLLAYVKRLCHMPDAVSIHSEDCGSGEAVTIEAVATEAEAPGPDPGLTPTPKVEG